MKGTNMNSVTREQIVEALTQVDEASDDPPIGREKTIISKCAALNLKIKTIRVCVKVTVQY